LAEVSIVEANLAGELERLCLGHDAIYVAEATFRRPLSEEDASYLSDNAIRVPLAELNLYYRNCRPDAWYGAGAQTLFSLAQHADLDFPATRSAQEQFNILGAQAGFDTPPAAAATQPTTAAPAAQADLDTPPRPAATQPTTAGPAATPAPSEQATAPEVLLAELIKAAPDEAMTQVRLGALALQEGTSLDTAGEYFQQAIDLDPTVWLAYGLWANSLGASGQITQSLQIVNQGLVAIPDNPALQAMQARLQDGAVSASSGDAYQTALEAGRSALRERNWEDAIGVAQQAVVQAPARYEAQLLLGDAHRGQGELAQALQAYQRATELAPYLSILHSRQAEMLARLGRVDESTPASLTALAIDQGRWENWYALGRAYQIGALAADAGLATPAAAQAAQQAEAFLLRAQALAPAENQAPARSLAELRAALPQPTASARAEPASQPVVDLDYASMSGQERIAARVQADQTLEAGQPAEALAIYQQLVAVDDQDRASRMGVANALAVLGRSDEALGEFEAISAGWPDFPFARIRQGALLEERGDLEGALAAYREAVRIAPDNANTHFTLAYALRRAGLRDEAIAAFEAGLELDPARDGASQALEALKSGQ
jgi:tetratricopeptide (TPR) repeat protein